MTITIPFTTIGITTWIVPFDWNNSNNSISAIGGGGVGFYTNGGGGGAYAAITNVSLIPGQTVYVYVGSGGSSTAGWTAGSIPIVANPSWFNKQSNNSPANTIEGVLANPGGAARSVGGGYGGIGGIGDVLHNGGNGVASCGGGGAAGSHGNGMDGSVYVPPGFPPYGGSGGAGDAGYGGIGGVPTYSGYSLLNAGGNGPNYGSGGGGASAGPGGLYGGGGSATEGNFADNWGAGGQGVVVISYTPGIAIPPPPPAASIKVTKNAVGGDDIFAFTSTISGQTSFNLATSNGTNSVTFANVTPGTYIITEGVSANGFALANLVCIGGSNTSIVGSNTIINLKSGENVICIYTNAKTTPQASIKVVKHTVNGDGTFTFTSNIAGLSSFNLTTSNGTASTTFANVTPGTYTIQESDSTNNFTFANLVCIGSSNTSFANKAVTFTLQTNDNIICVYTNMYTPPPPPPPPPAVCECVLPVFNPGDENTGSAKYAQYYWAYGDWADMFVGSAAHYDDNYNKLVTLASDNDSTNYDNYYDTPTSWTFKNEQENLFLDYPRVWKSRSNEWVDDGGQPSVWCRHRVTIANSLCVPDSEPSLSYVTCTTNQLYMDEQTRGWRLSYSYNYGLFSPGDVVAQDVNSGTTVYGTVYQMDQNYIWINIPVGQFFGGISVYNTNNPTVNAWVVAATEINEKYSSNVFIGQSRYISKSTLLATGQDAEDLQVYMVVYRPANTNFKVYGKVKSGDDYNLYNDRIWSRLVESNNTVSSFSSSTNLNDFIDINYDFPASQLLYGNVSGCSCQSGYQYITIPSTESFYTGLKIYLTDPSTSAFNVREVSHIVNSSMIQLSSFPSFSNTTNVNIGVIPGLEDQTAAFLYDGNNNAMRYVTQDDIYFDSFNQFAVKIVPISDNPVIVPRATDLRVLALQAD